MHALVLSLFLSQTAPPDAFGRGLLRQLAGTCEPVAESPLTVKVAAYEQRDAGSVRVWTAWPIGRCWPPRGRPFQLIADALEVARLEDGPLGAEVTVPPVDASRTAFTTLTTVPFPPAVEATTMPAYSVKTIRSVFTRVYRKPTATLDGVSAQLVYDTVMKARVRTEVDLWLKVLGATKPQQRKTLGRAYAEAAKQPGFESYSYLSGLSEQLLGKGAPREAYRVLGIVLRRTLDGTLGTVTTLWVQVLEDYDPELAKGARAQFMAR